MRYMRNRSVRNRSVRNRYMRNIYEHIYEQIYEDRYMRDSGGKKEEGYQGKRENIPLQIADGTS